MTIEEYRLAREIIRQRNLFDWESNPKQIRFRLAKLFEAEGKLLAVTNNNVTLCKDLLSQASNT